MRGDIKYWLGISKIQGIGAIKFKKLYSYFNSMEAAWQANFSELKRAGLEDSLAQNIIDERKNIYLDKEMEQLEKQDIKTVTVLDNEYPKLLKEIYNPPALLYYKGELENEWDKHTIGVVGTRKFSSYGKQVVEDVIGPIVKLNIVSVSGLALGIDSLVHEISVKNGKRTIAVLGSGLDNQNIYPSANRYLVQKIIANNGLVLSEYPVGTMPLQSHFPQRNRIIAGLTMATLVIEAPEKSGALITAKYALEFNRDILAVPGNIYNRHAAGTNNLIKMGAKLISSAGDILEALNIQVTKELAERKEITADSNEEKILLENLSSEPIHINNLIAKSRFGTATVNSTLILMEMKGKVRNLGNQMYVIGGQKIN